MDSTGGSGYAYELETPADVPQESSDDDSYDDDVSTSSSSSGMSLSRTPVLVRLTSDRQNAKLYLQSHKKKSTWYADADCVVEFCPGVMLLSIAREQSRFARMYVLESIEYVDAVDTNTIDCRQPTNNGSSSIRAPDYSRPPTSSDVAVNYGTSPRKRFEAICGRSCPAREILETDRLERERRFGTSIAHRQRCN